MLCSRPFSLERALHKDREAALMRLVTAPRRQLLEGVTAWLCGGVFIYALSIFGLRQLSKATGLDFVPCLLKQFTGQPCPLCGGTRSALLLGSGQGLAALQMNPLVTVSLVAFGCWLILRLVFARDVETRLSNLTRVIFLLTAVLINWAYIWTQQSTQ